jgi:hypothetical protein
MPSSFPRHGLACVAFAVATVVLTSVATAQANAVASPDSALRGPEALQAAAFDTLLREVMQERELQATLARARRPSVAPICLVVRSPSATLTPPWGADPSSAVLRAARTKTPMVVGASGCPAAPADTASSARETLDLVWVEPITRTGPGATFRAGIITQRGQGRRSLAGRDFRCQTGGAAGRSGAVQSVVTQSPDVQPGDTLPASEEAPLQVRCLADGAWFS